MTPQSHEEGANDSSLSTVSPVAFVGAYFMVKEIIGKKSEKKNQKRTEGVPVVPLSRVALAQALVTSFVLISFTPVNTQDKR